MSNKSEFDEHVEQLLAIVLCTIIIVGIFKFLCWFIPIFCKAVWQLIKWIAYGIAVVALALVAAVYVPIRWIWNEFVVGAWRAA